MHLTLLLLTFSASTFHASGDLQTFVDLVTTVQEYFASGCIFLLRDQDEKLMTTLMTAKETKLIFKKYIQTTLSSRSNGSLRCQSNRPLYVLPDKDRSINQNVTSRAIWLKFLETQSLTDFVGDKDIPFNSEFIVAQPKTNNQYVLKEVYRVSPGLPLQTSHFGSWVDSNDFELPKSAFYERRNNLLGASLRTAIGKFSDLDRDRRNRRGKFFGRVWKTLSKILNFKSIYVIEEQNSFGTRLDNNSWNGIIGMMQRKEVDVSGEELTMIPQRAEVVDYVMALRHERMEVVVKKVDSFELYWGSFLKPFSTKIWICIVFTIMLLTIILWIIYKAGRRYWSNRLNGKIISFHLHDSFFYIFDSFCQQAHDITPNSASGRLVYFASYLIAVVLLSGYSASLVSYLTVRRPTLPFTNFRELLEDGTYKFAVTASSAPYMSLKETNDSVLHELFLKYIHPYAADLPTSSLEGLRQVCEEKFAFMTSQEKLKFNADSLSCQFTTVPQAYIPISTAMAIAKGSPYRRLFSLCLLKLRSTGVLNRLKVNSMKARTVENSQFITMDIVSMTPLFTVLGIGTAVAILLFVMEILLRYLLKRNSRFKLPVTRIRQ